MGAAQPPAQHGQRAAAVREQDPQPSEPLQHPRHGDVGRGDRGFQRVADRVPQVVAVQGGDARSPRVDGWMNTSAPVPGGRVPEREEEVVAQVPAAHAGRDLHAVQAGHGHQAGQFLRGQARVLHRDRAELR